MHLGLRRRLSSSVIVSFLVRSSAVGLSLLTSVVLARLLGPEAYGVFTYAVTIAALLVIPASFGWPQLLVRLTASYRQTASWSALRGMLLFAPLSVLAVSILLTLGGVTVMAIWPTLASEANKPAFYLALLVVPVMALTMIVSSVVRGLHRVILGQLSEQIIRPSVLVLLILIVVQAFGMTLDAERAVALYLVSWSVALLFGLAVALRYLPWHDLAVRAAYPVASWLRSAAPLLLSGGMFFLHSRTDILMIGLFESADQVGIYQVASKSSGVLLFFLTLIAAVIAPYVASLYSAGENKTLQRVLSYSVGFAFLATLPAVLILFFFGEALVTLIFGLDYSPAYTPMVILAAGYFFSVCMGSCGLVLNMTGFEKKGAIGLGISSVANVALNLLLIPQMGIQGAALATAISIVLWNALLVHFVWQSTKLDTTILGFFRQPVLRELRFRS